jgi:YesN/AraC family two-component response regulator
MSQDMESVRSLSTGMQIKVLVVDDDTEIRRLLVDLVDEIGLRADEAANGLEALDKIKKQSYDIILTDLEMPGANGIEVLENARAIRSDVHVIIITGYASLETAIKAIKLGAYDYITKPFKWDEMRVAVQNAYEKIRLIRENKALIIQLNDACQELEELKHLLLDVNVKQITASKVKDNQRAVSPVRGELPLDPTPLHFQKRRTDKGPILVELEKLGQLLDHGILSMDEFEKCKDKLLTRF